MVWDTLRIVLRNRGLETAKPVVPTKPAGTSQAASFQTNNSQGLTSQLNATVVASHTLIPAGIGNLVGLSLRVTSMTPIGKTHCLKRASSAPLRTTKASNFCPVACMSWETTQKAIWSCLVSVKRHWTQAGLIAVVFSQADSHLKLWLLFFWPHLSYQRGGLKKYW